MIKDYSILFNGMSDGNKIFYYSLNDNTAKSIIMKVYNQYLEYIEYESALTLESGVNYWTSVSSNNKGRYVEFRDADTLEIVGMFGLDGVIDYKDIDYNSYVKTIIKNLKTHEKKDIHYILNEIVYLKIYNNEFVCVAENDIVFDIGFNYGFFALDSLQYKPKKIIGFEPNAKLVKAFNQLELDLVELNNVAVSDKNGSSIFYENNFSGKSSMHIDMNTDTKSHSYEVTVCNFMDVAKQYDVIDYLKVDCEGAEYEIFESIPNEFLANKINKIGLEFHHNINDARVIKLMNKIKECGFETKIDYKDGDSTGMLYARKK